MGDAAEAAADSMKCRYCGAENPDEQLRCVRCQNRLLRANPRPGPDHPVIDTAAVPKYADAPRPRQETRPKPVAVPTAGERNAIPSQQALHFPPPAGARPSGKVVAIWHEAPAAAPSTAVSGRAQRAPKAVSQNAQTAFEFQEVARPHRPFTLELDVKAAPCRVAPLALRGAAAALDGAIVLIMSCTMVATAWAIAGNGIFDGLGRWCMLAAPLLIGVFYKLVYCLAGGDTPGIRSAGLRLVNFMGTQPTRMQRFVRLLVSWVGTGAGMGLLWALFDEGTLTWHDHASQTFLTAEPVSRKP